jgi:hypothetical protein
MLARIDRMRNDTGAMERLTAPGSAGWIGIVRLAVLHSSVVSIDTR